MWVREKFAGNYLLNLKTVKSENLTNYLKLLYFKQDLKIWKKLRKN
jgi:hypothetical protein